MEISSPAGQLVLREPDFWGESQHGYPQLFIGASQQTGSPGMVAFDLSNIPNFQAQYASNLLQMQNWNIPRMELQIEGPAQLQITAPPEVEHSGEIFSRDATLRSQESQESGDSHWSQTPKSGQPVVSWSLRRNPIWIY